MQLGIAQGLPRGHQRRGVGPVPRPVGQALDQRAAAEVALWAAQALLQALMRRRAQRQFADGALARLFDQGFE
ncbi:hypothetical protein D3C77_788590 [compost metagenome]